GRRPAPGSSGAAACHDVAQGQAFAPPRSLSQGAMGLAYSSRRQSEESGMSDAQSKTPGSIVSRKHRARAENVVGQFLAIRASLKEAEAGGDEIDDIDEIAALLTTAAFKHPKR